MKIPVAIFECTPDQSSNSLSTRDNVQTFIVYYCKNNIQVTFSLFTEINYHLAESNLYIIILIVKLV